MGINWNEDQLKAIETRGKNILVSAAAGSGKTTVLVERIKRLIIDEKVPVDRFLIVTFTKAAAAEMKEKIIKALSQEAEKEGVDREYLRKQLELVPSANISTFNSFALDVIRKYFYLIDLEPGFKICDETQSELLRQEAADMVFEEEFERGDEDFLSFVSCYCSDRNEFRAKEMIGKLYNMIRSMPDPYGWLDEKTEALNVTYDEFKSGPVMSLFMDNVRHDLENIRDGIISLRDYMDENQCSILAGKYDPVIETLEALDLTAVTMEEAAGTVEAIKFPTMRATNDEKPFWEEIKNNANRRKDRIKKRIAGLKESLAVSAEQHAQDIQDTYSYACTLRRLVLEYDRAYRELKEAKNLLDFADQEHFALEILKHEEAAAEYREKFLHIFIDEYQDTNDVQETLISMIKRDNNLFMVGDVKQSIYKFRLAEPEIFMSKYEEYSPDDPVNLRVDLNTNFRSKGRILKAVNDIFLGRMDGYDDNAALRKGVAYDGALDVNPEIVIVDKNISEEMEVDDEVLNLQRTELEAGVAADIIKSVLGSEIADQEGNIRRTGYRDIVILMRGVKLTASVFAEVFEKRNIPCYVDDTAGYFDTPEITMIMSMLELIDNSRQDVPLLSVIYSPVFSFTTDEIAKIRGEGRFVPYYESFGRYIDEGSDEALRDKCKNVKECIGRWQLMAGSVTLHELVWNLIWDTGYYSYAGALPAGQQRQANLRALADKALAAEKMGIYDVYGFIQYVRAIADGRVNVGQMKTISEADDVVRIMTVHKSKGLEYPIVIAASLGKRFNMAADSGDIVMHKKLGYALVNINPKEHWKRKNILHSLINAQIRRESLEEEKRILYVDFTRAKDRLFMLGTLDKYEGNEDKFEDIPADNPGGYLEFILPAAYESGNIERRTVRMDDISQRHEAGIDARNNVKSIIDEAEGYSEETDRRLSFEYAHKQDTTRKYKYSVSELNEDAARQTVHSYAGFNSGGKGKISEARKGTVTHLVMERTDFRTGNVDETISALVRKNLLTAEEAEAVNVEGIRGFLESDLGKRAAAAENTIKEQPFTLLIDKDGSEAMVQGIIDAYFEEAGELVLIDYKNTNVSKDEVLKDRYRMQIDIYAEALEEITGKKVKEKYLVLLKQREIIDMNN